MSGGYSLLQGVRGCTAPSGTTFAGPAEWTDSTVGEGFRLEVDSYIRRPDGTQLAYTGLVDFEHTVDGGIPSWRAEAEGSFVDDAADGWLGEGASADVFAKLTGSGADAALQMTGGSSVGLSTVLFEDFTWDRACGSQPSSPSMGSLSRLVAALHASHFGIDVDESACGRDPGGNIQRGPLELTRAWVNLIPSRNPLLRRGQVSSNLGVVFAGGYLVF